MMTAELVAGTRVKNTKTGEVRIVVLDPTPRLVRIGKDGQPEGKGIERFNVLLWVVVDG